MNTCAFVFSTVAFGLVSIAFSEGLDIPVKPSRESALSPEQSLQAIVMDGPYEAQLVASEPLIHDPVEITWDAKGRAFVADMMDYPLGPPLGEKPLSRIVQLLEPDKNGRYTKSKIYADHVDHVQGLLPYKDGLIATTRTQILFLRDSKGDGVADEIKPLIEGFNPSHSQLQVASPRWGLDNCVYFNNGLNMQEIYPSGHSEAKQNMTRCNLRWDPATGKLEPTSGYGQFGGCFDDWGRHFFCSNRNPVMFAVMPYEAVIRNPHAGITQGWEDIAPTGGDTRVYPLQLTHTTANAHAGTHTAACGLGVYRGDLMPELRGEIFVCEPTAQCVVRYHTEPNGASLKATRVGDHTDFFRSHDEWCRPVNVTTGPDGALYICDIYRRYIDHARFFPEEFVKTHDMRAGSNEGRIWRIVPKGSKARTSEPAPRNVEDLVAWLGHKNAWQRETAQRLLIDSKPKGLPLSFSKLMADSSNRLGQVHTIWTLAKLAKISPEMPFQRYEFFGDENDSLFSTKRQMVPKQSAEQAITDELVEHGGFHGKWPNDQDAADKTQSMRMEWANYQETIRAIMFHSLLHMDGRTVDDIPDVVLPTTVRRLYFYDILLGGEFKVNGHLHDSAWNWMAKAAAYLSDDEWSRRAIMSGTNEAAGHVLKIWLSLPAPRSTDLGLTKFSQDKSDFIRALASCSAADAGSDDFAVLLSVLKQDPGKLLWWKPALLQGLAEGLPKSQKKLGVGTLAELTTKPPAQFKEAAAEIATLLAQVDGVMTDAAAPLATRLAVIPLLAQRSWDKAEPIMRALLADGQPPEIGTAALAVLRKFSTDKTAPLLYELLPKAGPAARRDVVAMLTSGKTLMDFLQRMERGEISKSLLGAEARWGFQYSAKPEIKALGEKLFGRPSVDRAAVIAAYMRVIKMKGDAVKGHQIFSAICIACHRIRGEGVDVGPDITDVRIKEKEALLSDILDPNRICEPRFMAYQVDTKDGRVLAGIVGAENSDSVTLKLAGGATENVLRSNIAKIKCTDLSLMPVGLEAGISKEQMADLLAFLKGE